MKLQDVIDINLLQKVQDSFAEATGLAAITVDFRGNPITKYSNFSNFCNSIRKDLKLLDTCSKCDAYGGLEAARSGTFYMYLCHAGLVDFSVPIIAEGQFVGSMLVGQNKINEEEKENLEYIVKESNTWQSNEEWMKEYERVPVTSYEKMKAAAEMMFYVINNMFEKDVKSIAQEELRKKDQQLIQQIKVQAKLEKALLDKQIQTLQLVVNPHFLFNVMNILTCSAIVEKAPKTHDVILTLSDIMKYVLTNTQDLVSLKDELSYINKYLKLQKLRFKDRIQIKLDIPEEMKSMKIPPLILQSILDNAIVHGIEPMDGNGIINIIGYSDNQDYFIEVSDDGIGMSQEKINQVLNEEDTRGQEKHLKGINFHNIISTLSFYYGNDYKPTISQNNKGGTTVTLRIPKN